MTTPRPTLSAVLCISCAVLLPGAPAGQSGSSYAEDPPLSLLATQGPVSTALGVCGFLDEGRDEDRGLTDVAVVVDGSLILLRDPGTRTERVNTSGTGILDLVLFPHGALMRDALLTVDGSSLQVWRWNSAGQEFVVESLEGSWTSPTRVVAAEWFQPQGWVLVVVLDGADDTLHPLLIAQGTQPGGSSAVVHSPLAARSIPPQALALFDYNANGHPDIAVADASGLDVFAVGNLPLLSQPHLADESWLVPLGLPAGGTLRQLAWVSRPTGTTTVEVRVVSRFGVEAPSPLSSDPILAASRARLDAVGLADLVLARADCLSATVFAADCPGAGSTFSATATCNELVEPAGSCVAGASGPPVAADLVPGGPDEVLLVDGGMGDARIFRKQTQTGLLGFTLTTGNLQDGLVQASIPANGLNGADDVQLTVWSWPDATVEEVDGTPLIDTSFEVAPSGGVTITNLALPYPDPAEQPVAVVLELRGVKGNGSVVSSGVYLMGDDCVFYDLARGQGGTVLQDPTLCKGGQGDWVGGIARLPRVPPTSSGSSNPH